MSVKMTGTVTKSYEEIQKNRNEGKSAELIKVEINPGDLIKATSVEEMMELATNVVPQIHKKMLMEPEGIPEEFKDKWLASVDEANHSLETAPQRRTMTEKKLAVLQGNRHPTASAKFHQANLEQASYSGQLIDLMFNMQKNKIRVEKNFYKYKKKKEKLEKMQAEGLDTFLLEKTLQEKQLDLVKDIMGLRGDQARIQNMREEIVEWSILKEKLFKEANENGEIWSPDSVDGDAEFQEVPLAIRHFNNMVMLIAQPDGSDISSSLNIAGLALTAMQNGLKENKLGFYFKDMNTEHIKLLWLHIFGKRVEVEQMPGFMTTTFEDGQKLIHPTTLETFKAMQSAKV